MKPTKRSTLSSTMLTGLLLTSINIGFTPALAQDANAPAATSIDDGTIIVTARKRGEDILKTPVAVVALTSDDIAKRGIVSVNDIVNSTPGINISNISNGRSDRSFQAISLRGFTPSTTRSTLVASFIDGVPVASATALSSISDPERIEILKGPQSAYFGRNAFAGAVNVVNKLPGDEFGGSVSAMRGTRNSYDVSGALEGPLAGDALSFRLTGRSFSKDGSYINGANGNETLGDQSTDTGTLLIVAKPFDGLTIKGFGLVSRNLDGPSAQGQISSYELRSNNGVENFAGVGTVIVPSLSNCNVTGSGGTIRPFICGAVPSLPTRFSPSQNTLEDSLLRNVLANGSQRIISPSQGTQGYGLKSLYYHLHLNVDYDVGNGVTLSSLTGYNNDYYSELADLDNYDSSLLTNSAYITAAFPAGNPNVRSSWDFPFLVERKTFDFSQEFRAAYDNKGPLSALIGVSYLNTNSNGDLVNVQSEIIGGAPRNTATTTQPKQKIITKGIFGSLTYHVTDQFTVSAEGRYQEDKVYGFLPGGPSLVANAGNSFGVPAGTYAPFSLLFAPTFKNFLPRVIVQYEANPDLMAYASWSKGLNVDIASFNTQFLNRSPTIVKGVADLGIGLAAAPEKLENYEVGLKGKFFDGHLRATLAAYYAIWSKQLNNRSGFVQDEAPPAGTGNIEIVSGLANSGKTIIKGIEFDMMATPIDGLAINYGMAFNDSNIKSNTNPALSAFYNFADSDYRGKSLPATSKYSANLGIQYGTDIAGWDDSSWFIRGDASYKSKQYIDAANLTWIKSRTQVNFRAGVNKGAFGLEAFVTNAFNNRDYVSGSGNALLTPFFSRASTNAYINVGLPELRTFGLKGSFKF